MYCVYPMYVCMYHISQTKILRAKFPGESLVCRGIPPLNMRSSLASAQVASASAPPPPSGYAQSPY